MARTKTQKQLTIAKTKSESIVGWFIEDAHWKLLSENLELGKTAIFKYKKKLQESEKENSAFDALAETFTLKQINTVITMFNDFIDHPEKYEKPKKKSEIDLEKQEEAVKKHMKDMNMDYLNYQKEAKDSEEKPSTEKEEKSVKKTEKTIEKGATAQVIGRQREEIEEEYKVINQLPEGSPERAEKEAEFKHKKAARMKEFWDSEKQERKAATSKEQETEESLNKDVESEEKPEKAPNNSNIKRLFEF